MIPQINKHKSVVPNDSRSDLELLLCGMTTLTFGVWWKKLLSLIGVTCQAHVSPVRQVMWSHAHVLWQPAGTNLSVLQVTAGSAVSTTQRNVRLPGDVNSKAAILSVRYTVLPAVAHVFVRPGHCVSSTCVLPLPEALHHIRNRHHGCPVPMHILVMNLHQRSNLHMQKSNHFVPRHLTMFLVGD